MSRSRKLVAAVLPALALLLAPPLAALAAESKEVKLSGMGIRKCSEWQHWKETRNNESRAMALEWAQGFISGHNVYARTGGTAASAVVANVTVLIPLLDSYCQKNPGERILAGVVEITKGLGGTKIDLTPKTPTPPLPSTPPRPDTKGRQES